MTKEEYIDTNEYGYDTDNGIWSKAKEKFLEGHIEKNGYKRVLLKCVDGKKRNFLYHRAIWYMFNGEIPEGYEVNHIDENKQNNALSNLNLMTHKENINWGTGHKRASAKQRNHPNESKAVVAVKNDMVVLEFASTREAGRQGFGQGNVAKCCRNCYYGSNIYKGYRWFLKKDWLQMQKQIASPHKREDAIQLELNLV